MKMEILLEPTSNKLMVDPHSSITFASEVNFSSSRTPGLVPVPLLEGARTTMDSSKTLGILPVPSLEKISTYKVHFGSNAQQFKLRLLIDAAGPKCCCCIRDKYLQESKDPQITRYRSKGTGSIPRVSDKSIVVPAPSSKGTGTKPGVLDEEKFTSEANVILEWGFEQESEYSKEDDDDED
nr:hypothetical protein [Tanacetum cinerariifolium]